MSEIKTGGLDQYGTGPFEQQQCGTAGVEGVKTIIRKPRGRKGEATVLYAGQKEQRTISTAFQGGERHSRPGK